MDWVSFGKRLIILLIICLIVGGIVNLLIFQFWTLSNYFLVLLFMGIIFLVFGACLQTAFVEAIATARYAVNPQVTRDTMRHYSDRRYEQEKSGIVLLATGALLLLISLLGLVFLPYLPM